jgi:hypothetical protein
VRETFENKHCVTVVLYLHLKNKILLIFVMKLNVAVIGVLVRLHFITFHVPTEDSYYNYRYPVIDQPEFSTVQTNYNYCTFLFDSFGSKGIFKEIDFGN